MNMEDIHIMNVHSINDVQPMILQLNQSHDGQIPSSFDANFRVSQPSPVCNLGPYKVRCPSCQKRFGTAVPEALQEHIRMGKCLVCEKQLACYTRMMQHMTKGGCRAHLKILQPQNFKCPKCLLEFSEVEPYLAHKTYKTCVLCHQAFVCQTEAEFHKISNLCVKPGDARICIDCLLVLHTDEELAAHRKSAVCACGIQFACQAVMQYHTNMLGCDSSASNNNNNNEQEDQQGEMFLCSFCDEQFSTEDELLHHQTKKVFDCRAKLQCFECSFCEKNFESQTDLTNHQLLKICRSCNLFFGCSRKVDLHEQRCIIRLVTSATDRITDTHPKQINLEADKPFPQDQIKDEPIKNEADSHSMPVICNPYFDLTISPTTADGPQIKDLTNQAGCQVKKCNTVPVVEVPDFAEQEKLSPPPDFKEHTVYTPPVIYSVPYDPFSDDDVIVLEEKVRNDDDVVFLRRL